MSHSIANSRVAVARATATLKVEKAWMLIYAPPADDGLHYTDRFGYLLTGLADEGPHAPFLVTLLRNVADMIEEANATQDPAQDPTEG